MIALVLTAAAAGSIGATLGLAAGTFCADRRVADAEASADRAFRRAEAAEDEARTARADSARWRRLAETPRPLTIGPGSPWAPSVTAADEAAS